MLDTCLHVYDTSVTQLNDSNIVVLSSVHNYSMQLTQ